MSILFAHNIWHFCENNIIPTKPQIPRAKARGIFCDKKMAASRGPRGKLSTFTNGDFCHFDSML